MHLTLLKIGIFAALLIASLGASASTIPDDPVVAIEPGIEIDDRLGGVMGWVDDHTLLVTAQIDSKSQFWERKVMLVDVRTGNTKELFYQGALICANPTEGVAAILVGSEESMYLGNSKAPKPDLKLYSWSSLFGVLTPKISSDSWNSWICKKTKSADVNVPNIDFMQKDIRYLEAKDGYLNFSMNQSRSERSVILIKNDKPVATLDAKPIEIAPAPQYLPFRDEYLLSSGRFVMNSTMVRGNEAPTTEFPVLTMATSGKLKREYFKPLFESYGFTDDGETFPYAKGTMIFVGSRPQHGGGIYLNQGKSLKRIWCTNKGNTFDRTCHATSISMSPDGCHFAFFANSSDNLMSPYVYRPTLKILPLCR
jgi:hypothetical protein